MPQIGPLEILVVGVLALMVFGPDKLPDMARSVGRFVNQAKSMASEAKSEFDFSLDEKNEKKDIAAGGDEVAPATTKVRAGNEKEQAPDGAAPPSDGSGTDMRPSSADHALVSRP